MGGFAGDAITRLHCVVSRRGRFGLVAAGGSPDEAEERADFAGELFWLLECGEVATPGWLVPVDDVGEASGGPAAAGTLEFFGEDRASGREVPGAGGRFAGCAFRANLGVRRDWPVVIPAVTWRLVRGGD